MEYHVCTEQVLARFTSTTQYNWPLTRKFRTVIFHHFTALSMKI